MAYTNVWDVTIPTGAEAANTIGTLFRTDKINIQERLIDIFSLPSFVTDPLRPYNLKFSSVPSTNDFLMGAANTRFRDAANANTNLNISDAGIITSRSDIRGPSLTIKNFSLEEYVTNASSAVLINFNGYAGGTTQFRDFGLYDGKNNVIFSTLGSSKASTFTGSITAPSFRSNNGTLNIGAGSTVNVIFPAVAGLYIVSGYGVISNVNTLCSGTFIWDGTVLARTINGPGASMSFAVNGTNIAFVNPTGGAINMNWTYIFIPA